MERLFFAVWPGEAARALARLAFDVATVSGGKAVPQAKIHITLAFLGEMTEERERAACAAAHGLAFDRFSFALDHVGCFRSARVAWAGSAEAPPPLVALHAALAARLAAARFPLEERAFAPHATLARRTRSPVALAAIEPIVWRVDAFSLVRSDTGSGRYRIVEEYRAR